LHENKTNNYSESTIINRIKNIVSTTTGYQTRNWGGYGGYGTTVTFDPTKYYWIEFSGMKIYGDNSNFENIGSIHASTTGVEINNITHVYLKLEGENVKLTQNDYINTYPNATSTITTITPTNTNINITDTWDQEIFQQVNLNHLKYGDL